MGTSFLPRTTAGSWLLLLLAATTAGATPPGEAQAEAAAVPAPRALVEVAEVDAGEVPRGQAAEASFVIKNTGDATLRILKAKPG